MLNKFYWFSWSTILSEDNIFYFTYFTKNKKNAYFTFINGNFIFIILVLQVSGKMKIKKTFSVTSIWYNGHTHFSKWFILYSAYWLNSKSEVRNKK